MANAADVGETGSEKTCAVGIMLMPVHQEAHGFGDFAKFLLGWLLLYDVDPAQYETYPLSLGRVMAFQALMRDPKTSFWKGFPEALLTIVKNQFAAQLKPLQNHQDQSFVVIPPWPDSTFEYVRPFLRESGVVSVVMKDGRLVSAPEAAFADYCQHLIATTLAEIRQLINDPRSGSETPNDPTKTLLWSDIWQRLSAPL
jgi:hypothetical protein